MTREEFDASMLLLGCKCDRIMDVSTFNRITRYSLNDAFTVVEDGADEQVLPGLLEQFITNLEK